MGLREEEPWLRRVGRKNRGRRRRASTTGANAGDHRGREEVFAFFEQAARLTGGTLRFRLHDVLVGDRYAAAVATYIGRHVRIGRR